VPVWSEEGLLIASLSSEYLVYNFEVDSYHLMTETTLNKCQKWQAQGTVCEGNWPWSNANDLACEVRPLKPGRPANCIYIQANCRLLISEIFVKGAWSPFENHTKNHSAEIDRLTKELKHLKGIQI